MEEKQIVLHIVYLALSAWSFIFCTASAFGYSHRADGSILAAALFSAGAAANVPFLLLNSAALLKEVF